MTNEEKENFEEEPATLTPEVEGEIEADLVKSGAATVSERLATDDEVFGENEGQLAIDVYQTPEEIVVESPIAGVAPEDIDIGITSESVTIKGKREHS